MLRTLVVCCGGCEKSREKGLPCAAEVAMALFMVQGVVGDVQYVEATAFGARSWCVAVIVDLCFGEGHEVFRERRCSAAR